MLVGQFLDAFVVGDQPQPQQPEHGDAPLRQAGEARLRAGLAFRTDPLQKHLHQDGKHALAQAEVGVEVPTPSTVAGLGVQFDVGDGDLAEFHLGVEQFA